MTIRRIGPCVLAVACRMAPAVPAPASAQLVNPDFESDLSGWTEETSPGIGLSWIAGGSPSPGAAQILSPVAPETLSFGRLQQCLNGVTPDDAWRATVRAQATLRPADECGLTLRFYPCADCGCGFFPAPVTPLQNDTSEWVTLVNEQTAPEGSLSALIKVDLVAVAPSLAKSSRIGDPSSCHFDHVRLAVNGIYEQEFEFLPTDWSGIVPAPCDGLCGTQSGDCFCDVNCRTFEDCCIDACSTCGVCPP